jgi:sugar phosphate isomerase/epimerase
MKAGLQLYSVRDFTKTGEGFRSALRRTKEIGYEGVQLSAVGCMEGTAPEVSAELARAWLDDAGLACCGTHRPFEALRDRFDEEVDFHRALGCGYVAIGGPPAGVMEQGLIGWQRLADGLSLIAEKLSRAGLKFGYHNHALEFERLPPDGRRPFEILMERCSHAVNFEVDTYWVVHSGTELLPLLERLKGRMPLVHLKDKQCIGWETDYAPVGEGNLAWDRILPRFAAAGTEWLVVEQDTSRRDIWDCVASSRSFLASALSELPNPTS